MKWSVEKWHVQRIVSNGTREMRDYSSNSLFWYVKEQHQQWWKRINKTESYLTHHSILKVTLMLAFLLFFHFPTFVNEIIRIEFENTFCNIGFIIKTQSFFLLFYIFFVIVCVCVCDIRYQLSNNLAWKILQVHYNQYK